MGQTNLIPEGHEILPDSPVTSVRRDIHGRKVWATSVLAQPQAAPTIDLYMLAMQSSIME